MKLYRFTGRAELFVGCGFHPIDYTVMANLTQLKKYANKWRAEARKKQLEHSVRIESIEIHSFNQKLVCLALSTEETEHMVKSVTVLKSWDWSREP
jgi:hypothetical protein